MSRKEKLLLRLLRKPSPCDFTWDELLALMHFCGFWESCTGGSHHVFEHEACGLRLFLARPHPLPVLKRYQVQAVVDALAAVGAISEPEP